MSVGSWLSDYFNSLVPHIPNQQDYNSMLEGLFGTPQELNVTPRVGSLPGDSATSLDPSRIAALAQNENNVQAPIISPNSSLANLAKLPPWFGAPIAQKALDLGTQGAIGQQQRTAALTNLPADALAAAKQIFAGTGDSAPLTEQLKPRAPLVSRPGDILRNPNDPTQIVAQNPEEPNYTDAPYPAINPATGKVELAVRDTRTGLPKFQGIAPPNNPNQPFNLDGSANVPYQKYQQGLRENDEAGWQVLTDTGNNNQPYRYNPRTAQSTDLNGNPYSPKGAQKLGTGSFRSALAMAMNKFITENPNATSDDVARYAGIYNRTLKAIGSEVNADASSLNNITKISDASAAFENTAMKNFNTALSLADKAVPTDWGPWLNRWIMNGETALGNKDVPPYVAAILTGANEYAKVMAGSTGSQGSTVDSRREAAELFSPYLSKGQIKAVVDIAYRDMENKKSSYSDMRDQIKARIGQGAPQAGSAAPQPDAPQAPDRAPGSGPQLQEGQTIKQGGNLFKVINGKPVYQGPAR